MFSYLLHSNDFDTLGLVYQSARVHWKGDGEGTVSEHLNFGLGEMSNWRWNEDETFMEDAVELYAEVYENLIVHAEGYPTSTMVLMAI